MFSPSPQVAACCAATAWGHTSAASPAACIFSIDSPGEHGNLALHDDQRILIRDARNSSRDAGNPMVRDSGSGPCPGRSVSMGFSRHLTGRLDSEAFRVCIGLDFWVIPHPVCRKRPVLVGDSTFWRLQLQQCPPGVMDDPRQATRIGEGRGAGLVPRQFPSVALFGAAFVRARGLARQARRSRKDAMSAKIGRRRQGLVSPAFFLSLHLDSSFRANSIQHPEDRRPAPVNVGAVREGNGCGREGVAVIKED
jgi:hypothetical protein